MHIRDLKNQKIRVKQQQHTTKESWRELMQTHSTVNAIHHFLWLTLMVTAVTTGFGQPLITAQPQSQTNVLGTTYTVAESAGTVTLIVQRSGDTNLAVSVNYSTSDGTATSGTKYTAVSGTLASGPGQINRTIMVPILNEGFVEGTKTFQVLLS